MSELTPDDIWFCGRIADNHFNSGYLVTTKAGLKGVTYHKDALVDGKRLVYALKDGKEVKLLCHPDSLTLNGFID
ncbi:hypothetical protein [Proteiniphilum acetatigenes]|uniref:hypothetical protein n=1 Tax=Proteiniphilum acetatigenes TaxID=294710 RepID=UPI00037E5FE2|nr:hypothetical protein [Proteiniphilum acetatigenes]